MIRKSLIPAAVAVFIASVAVLIVVAAIFINNHPSETKEVSRIQEMLYNKYKTSFVYERRESTDTSDERVQLVYGTSKNRVKKVDLYFFHPEDDEGLSFYTIHGIGTTSMVFSIKEYCYDNFKNTLFDKVLKGKKFSCMKENMEELADSIYSVQTELINASKNYNMTDNDILISEKKNEFEIAYKGEIHKAEFTKHDKDEILKTLQTIVNNYNIYLMLISTAGEDGSPAIWEADDGLCTVCNEEADCIFEFCRDGTFRLKLKCGNCGSYIREAGKIEISNNVLVNVNDYGFSVMLEIKEIKNNVTDVDGKNTCIVMKNIATYSKSGTLLLYGNVSEKDMVEAG